MFHASIKAHKDGDRIIQMVESITENEEKFY
jgi:hypothetical protein